MIKVCDAIMGSGKTSAAITYINEHPERRFIYVTPFLSEANRIKNECPNAKFVEPSGKLKKYGFSKCNHTLELVKSGRNITTTHQALKLYGDEIKTELSKHDYTLIIDENVDVLEHQSFNVCDLEILEREGYIETIDGNLTRTDKEYTGEAFKRLLKELSKRNNQQKNEYEDFVDDGTEQDEESSKNQDTYYWLFPKETLMAFREVIVMTYLFEGQSLHHLFKIADVDYVNIGVNKDEAGVFRFVDGESYTPSYVSKLSDLIQIVDNPRLNEIGNKKHALSMSWFANNDEGVEQLKLHTTNFFKNISPGDGIGDRLWGCYQRYRSKVSGAGYARCFLPFNSRSTNEFRNRHVLAYTVNLFMNVGDKLYYKNNGVEVDEDHYALSIMVQWIWRSAIRDGNPVTIYIPSMRMRNLLRMWIYETSQCGNPVVDIPVDQLHRLIGIQVYA